MHAGKARGSPEVARMTLREEGDSGALGRLGKGDGPGAVCVLFLGSDIAVVVTVSESFL